MRVWTWRPGWDPLSELQRQVDRIFDFTADMSRQLWHGWRQFPPFNLYETQKEYIILALLPGAKPEDVEINIVGNSMTLKGDRRRLGSVLDECYRRQERWHGKWSRSIQLPDKADDTQVAASLENGLLVVRMPKVPETQPRQVPVTVSRPQ